MSRTRAAPLSKPPNGKARIFTHVLATSEVCNLKQCTSRALSPNSPRNQSCPLLGPNVCSDYSGTP